MPVMAIFTSLYYWSVQALAWAGGIVFAGSLGYLVYFYAIVLSSPDGDAGRALVHAAIDIGLFSAFAAHHSLLARTGAKASLARFVPPAAERTVYVWTASLLLVAVCVLWQPVPGAFYEVPGVWRLPFYALQLVGAVLTIRSAGVIDPLELAGIRQAAARPSRDVLQVVGPFRVVRHPIYLGWMLMVFAAPTMTVNRLLFATISSAYLVLAIPWEEKSLIAAHGDHYRAYQRQVRWRVVPRVW
jgi:protein-S-isoprenylcysteine O-methyltransferase Ste14